MHKLESVQENETHKILCDFEIQTDPLISARRLGQEIARDRTCWIVDFAVAADCKVKIKASEKIDKYMDLVR